MSHASRKAHTDLLMTSRTATIMIGRDAEKYGMIHREEVTEAAKGSGTWGGRACVRASIPRYCT